MSSRDNCPAMVPPTPHLLMRRQCAWNPSFSAIDGCARSVPSFSSPLPQAMQDLQAERQQREQLKAEIAAAEQSSAAAKKLASEVQGLQQKLAGVLKKQLAAAASLQGQLDAATSECGALRDQVAAAERRVGIH